MLQMNRVIIPPGTMSGQNTTSNSNIYMCMRV